MLFAQILSVSSVPDERVSELVAPLQIVRVFGGLEALLLRAHLLFLLQRISALVRFEGGLLIEALDRRDGRVLAHVWVAREGVLLRKHVVAPESPVELCVGAGARSGRRVLREARLDERLAVALHLLLEQLLVVGVELRAEEGVAQCGLADDAAFRLGVLQQRLEEAVVFGVAGGEGGQHERGGGRLCRCGWEIHFEF